MNSSILRVEIYSERVKTSILRVEIYLERVKTSLLMVKSAIGGWKSLSREGVELSAGLRPCVAAFIKFFL